MKIEDVLKLSEAGFSTDQIVALAGFMGGNNIQMTEQPQTKVAEAQNIVEPKPNPENTPVEKVEESAKPSAAIPEVNEAIAKMNEAANRIIASNIHATNQPAQKSVDDILAEIINPPMFNQ